MDAIEKAFETQLSNIQKKTGKNLDELYQFITKSGLTKHAEIRDLLKTEFNIGFGDANTLAHAYKKSLEPAKEPDSQTVDGISEIYTGAKQSLIPIHHKVMQAIQTLGEFEISPKKTYLSLRRKKQFAMVGPGTKGRLEIGLNIKNVSATERLVEQPPGGMCQFKVWLTGENEVDPELVNWIRIAYDSAG